jgi:hypothetical protein
MALQTHHRSVEDENESRQRLTAMPCGRALFSQITQIIADDRNNPGELNRIFSRLYGSL